VEQAGLADRVEVRVGDAAEVLQRLGPDGSFDVVFLDADKERYTTYMEEAARLLRPRGLLLADNAFWAGRVLDPATGTIAERLNHFNEVLSSDHRFDATILPVGDGLLVAVRR
jgi:predicted O-methyltransferase YrrM